MRVFSPLGYDRGEKRDKIFHYITKGKSKVAIVKDSVAAFGVSKKSFIDPFHPLRLAAFGASSYNFTDMIFRRECVWPIYCLRFGEGWYSFSVSPRA